MKSKFIAYLLWFFLGIFSAHRFYLKKYNSAVLFLVTFQLLGLGWIYDSLELGKMVDKYNLRRGYYGPVRGLDQSILVNINTRNQQSKPSPREQSVAS